jgi:hypothetical protein
MDTFKGGLLRALLFWLLSLSVTIGSGCSRSTRQESDSNKNSEPAPSIETNPPRAKEDAPKMFADFFEKGDSLSFNDYVIVKLHKTVTLEPGVKAAVSYAVLKRKGHAVARFDGVYHSAGNATDFGLCSLFGGQSKQLLVSQTVPRGGRHWVVDLSSGASILFDSYDYGLGREEVFLMDVDKDGVSEIGLLLTAFWGFESLAMSQHEALPMIVFKYDPRSRKYLPANPLFAYGLDGIEENARAIDPGEKVRDSFTGEYLGKRLGIFLRYVYAGKREQGWSFFDRTYKLADADQMKAKIRTQLRREPVYRFIYRRRSRPPVQK